ncbi:unnamed protein product [Closterium sp. Naga37s-1]|nr:unnamed protein product [Closterium sp. Naga37s-1]
MATPVVGAAAQVGASGGATAARAADAERAQLVQQLNLVGVRARVAELQGSIARVMGAFHEQHVHLKCWVRTGRLRVPWRLAGRAGGDALGGEMH